jgi:hypothetical protein
MVGVARSKSDQEEPMRAPPIVALLLFGTTLPVVAAAEAPPVTATPSIFTVSASHILDNSLPLTAVVKLMETEVWRKAFIHCEQPLRRSELQVGQQPFVPRPQHAPFEWVKVTATFQCGQVTTPDLKERLDGATLVIQGVVRSVVPVAKSGPTSEHDPKWQQATVEVLDGMKGAVPAKTVNVFFPGSDDVSWVGRHKFLVGQQGIWLLRQGEANQSSWPVAGYTALEALDFHPLDHKSEIYALLHPVAAAAPNESRCTAFYFSQYPAMRNGRQAVKIARPNIAQLVSARLVGRRYRVDTEWKPLPPIDCGMGPPGSKGCETRIVATKSREHQVKDQDIGWMETSVSVRTNAGTQLRQAVVIKLVVLPAFLDDKECKSGFPESAGRSASPQHETRLTPLDGGPKLPLVLDAQTGEDLSSRTDLSSLAGWVRP